MSDNQNPIDTPLGNICLGASLLTVGLVIGVPALYLRLPTQSVGAALLAFLGVRLFLRGTSSRLRK
jgi:hypothetical protein